MLSRLLQLSICFIVLFALDFVFAFYINKTAEGKATAAAWYSVLIVLLTGLNTLLIVQTPTNLVASCVGGWFGAYVGVKRSKHGVA